MLCEKTVSDSRKRTFFLACVIISNLKYLICYIYNCLLALFVVIFIFPRLPRMAEGLFALMAVVQSMLNVLVSIVLST